MASSTIHLDRDCARINELEEEINGRQKGPSQEEWANQKLMGHVEEGWLEGVKTLLKSGLCDARCENEAGETPLLVAQRRLHSSTVSTLVEHILFHRDARDLNGEMGSQNLSSSAEYGLSIACWTGQEDEVRLHAPGNPGLDDAFTEGLTPLMLSCMRGELKICIALLDAGANVNAKSSGKWTPLMCAALNGHTGIVNMLKSSDADFNARDERGTTVLMGACASKNCSVETVSALIRGGAKVNALRNDKQTALMLASGEGGDVEKVRALIEEKAYVNARDNGGKTALMFASCSGDVERVRVLIEKGARLDDRDKQNKTAKDLAKDLVNSSVPNTEYGLFKSIIEALESYAARKRKRASLNTMQTDGKVQDLEKEVQELKDKLDKQDAFIQTLLETKDALSMD